MYMNNIIIVNSEITVKTNMLEVNYSFVLIWGGQRQCAWSQLHRKVYILPLKCKQSCTSLIRTLLYQESSYIIIIEKEMSYEYSEVELQLEGFSQRHYMNAFTLR